ncbi:YitT family protein [Enterococcus rivorum]|uniref:DUF2179 domain-containing protein n=1 Tax=Enterococcus rivorum TaxID=762845 RepID=A0A1E5L1M8_9ENTE|nr:YitT family protein [Enterococcus rivorum]MBP2097739.1 uncharacterized membrane-anchored protein YitT (DUF2179 family) [Enterococcus rivorum]OEH84007.1 hypothetical protein BCR26_00615 [Enterococcus rivorum]
MKDQIKNLIKITFAVLLLAISVNMFFGPHHVVAGGVSGLGILMEQLLNIDRSVVVFALNIVMLILAAIFLGKKVFFNTLYGSMLFPFLLAIVPEIMLTSDRLLSVIFGSTIFATGVAILYKIRASSGGTTIPPLIFEKYFNVSPSIGLFVTDTFIVTLSLFVFGFEEFLFAILANALVSIVMTYIETGLKRRKALMIISKENAPEIKEALKEEVARGMTLFDIKGGNDSDPNEMILMVASNQEYPEIKAVIDKIDPMSFVVVYNVSEVHGLGFTYHPIQ